MDWRLRGSAGRTRHNGIAGGIGENAPPVRARICDGLGFLGIELDEKQNATNEGLISAKTSGIPVRVIPTDEERMIAEMVCRVLGLTPGKGKQTSERYEHDGNHSTTHRTRGMEGP